MIEPVILDGGRVKLFLGDCLQILPTLEAGSVDCVVTDPPYGIGFKYATHDDNPAAYEAMMKAMVTHASVVIKDGGLMFVWQAMRQVGEMHKWFPDGYRLFAAAKNFTQHLPTPVQFSWDPVAWWSKGQTQKRAICGQRDFHIGNTAKWVLEKSNGHPCPRPVDTCEYVVGLASDEGEIVLDPFMGSGTTGVACIRTGRSFIGIEIDEHYFNIARQRIERELDARNGTGPLMKAAGLFGGNDGH